ncbi:MAG TPA: hypothetical protein VFX50_03970 [Gemmatimonadales bacterium]|nr:hypothetical protein [Gemmatimonadales bacterium]
MSARARAIGVAAVALLGAAASWRVEAHKPITSPYTFTEDVLPILRDRCTACHVAGGPAPMALTTAEEAVPWGESIRLELVAGHMPPWSATSNGARLRHAEGLTARELNVLLTWVTGGTPINAPPPAPAATAAAWGLGTPDAVVPLPEVSVAADQAELTREFVLPLDAAVRRPLRAVDVKPGTRSLVRSAEISVRTAAPAGDLERIVALWVPGDTPAPLPAGAVLEVPGDAALVVRVRYKKTWEHERDAMRDRSEVGLYFGAGTSVRRATVPTGPLRESVRLVSVYPSPASAGRRVTLDATLPDGATRRIIEFTPRPGWDRRYAFDPPFDLPAGTRLSPADGLVLNVIPRSLP